MGPDDSTKVTDDDLLAGVEGTEQVEHLADVGRITVHHREVLHCSVLVNLFGEVPK